MAELRGGTTIGGYTAWHMGNLPIQYNGTQMVFPTTTLVGPQVGPLNKLVVGGQLDVTQTLRIGISNDVAPVERLEVLGGSIKTDGSIKIYNGTTQVGELTSTDTGWLRINQNVDRPIFTPRAFRADNGICSGPYNPAPNEVRASMFRGLNSEWYMYPTGNNGISAVLSGKIGINTTVPFANLHIVSGRGNDSTWMDGVLVENTSTDTGECALSFKNAGANGTGSNYWIYGLNQGQGLTWAYGNAFIDANSKMRLTIDGKLGVGTLAPTETLEVNGFVRSASGYKIGTSTVLDSHAGLYASHGDFSGDVNVQGNLGVAGGRYINLHTGVTAPPLIGGKSAGAKVILWDCADASHSDFAIGIDGYTMWYGVGSTEEHHKFYAGSTELMRIQGNGKVGIGTVAPSEALEVAGYIRSNTGIKINGNCLVDSNTNIVANKVTVGSGGLTINKNGTDSTITFPAQTNDPGYIKHIESNNTAEMRFSVSDDNCDGDYFTWGSTPGGVWQETARLTASGLMTLNGLTVKGNASATKFVGPLQGNADSATNADTVDGLHVHTGKNNEANKIVRTDVNGYIQAGWISTVSGQEISNPISRVYASTSAYGGDGYLRYYTLPNFSLQVRNLSSKEDSTADYPVSTLMRWQKFGNNHVIFDASAGIAPNGSTINNTDAATPWSDSYPTLMGWNGSTTYGIRVDSARMSEKTAFANKAAIANTALSANTCTGAYSMISRDSRDIVSKPIDRDAGLYADFKHKNTDGLDDGNQFHGVLTFRPYGSKNDWSGGSAKQLAFTENANMYIRRSIGDNDWSGWNKVLTHKDMTMIHNIAFNANCSITTGYIVGNPTIPASSPYKNENSWHLPPTAGLPQFLVVDLGSIHYGVVGMSFGGVWTLDQSSIPQKINIEYSDSGTTYLSAVKDYSPICQEYIPLEVTTGVRYLKIIVTQHSKSTTTDTRISCIRIYSTSEGQADLAYVFQYIDGDSRTAKAKRLTASAFNDTKLESGVYTNTGDGLPGPNGSIALSGWFHVWVSRHYDMNGFGGQLAMGFSGGGNEGRMYIRYSNGTNWDNWKRLLSQDDLKVQWGDFNTSTLAPGQVGFVL